MNATAHFRTAASADKCGTAIFYTVALISGALLFFGKAAVEEVGQAVLVVLAILAITCTVITSIQQTEGNRELRSTQLSDALGARVGEEAREGYYNNILPPSLQKLAATTLENTLFTKEVLAKMAVRERIKCGFYFLLLLVLLFCRWTPASWLLMLAQTLFSADLALKWMRLERFRIRANRVFDQLEQFFQQKGDPKRPTDFVILLVAFTDYECAKDEAVLPLDDRIFKRLNPGLSQQWSQMQKRLEIQ